MWMLAPHATEAQFAAGKETLESQVSIPAEAFIDRTVELQIPPSRENPWTRLDAIWLVRLRNTTSATMELWVLNRLRAAERRGAEGRALSTRGDSFVAWIYTSLVPRGSAVPLKRR